MALSDSEKLSQLWAWAFGNGVKGADERIRDMSAKIDDFSTGNTPCYNHKELMKHIDWHDKSKNFMWAILVPVYLTMGAILIDLILRLSNK